MIFAAMGTSVPFPRLLKRLDEIAAELPEEILVQTGTTPLRLWSRITSRRGS